MMWLKSRNTVTYLEAVTKFSRSQWLLTSCSYSVSCKKTKMAPLQERRMIDRIRLWAKAGDGGNGCTSFRRSRSDRRGKPDGGNGGRGGDVILECSSSVWDLSSVQHHINAKRGGHGAPKNMIGSRGADKIVLVPVGTVLHLLEGELPSTVEKKSSGPLDPWDIPGTLDFSSEESCQQSPIDKTSVKIEKKDEGLTPSTKQTLNRFPPTEDSQNKPETNWLSEAQGFSEWDNFDGKTDISEPESDDEEEEEEEQIQYNIAELTEPGQRIIVARGGEGGSGNLESEKVYRAHKDSNTNGDNKELSDDDVAPNIGTPGTETILLLELKSIADVGLVGIPNAGKSTLLGALSRAKPIVGNYAFTTLRPNLGNLNYDDLSITVADIPGLIKGAHENRGLGHAFLRHIERTKVLAYVVDLAAGTGGRKGVPPWEQLRDLMVELEFYSEGLSSRPCLVVANKIDEAGCDEVYEELRRRVTGVPIFPVCAVLDEGIPELKDGLKLLVNGGELCGLSLESVLVD